jgi:hypothetical protein
MANPEHVEILKQGVEEWNRWREVNRYIRPDLNHEDLRGISLSGANLAGADITYADMSGSDLTNTMFGWAELQATKLCNAMLIKARFYSADLGNADLTLANLKEAEFFRAIIYRTNLTGANLRQANLTLSEFNVANLTDADLYEAVINLTTFSETDLRRVKGLEPVKHQGPSTIGIDTLHKSKGEISEQFLRGCGVPEIFITFARSLVNNPVEFYSCFISYSHQGKSFARRLHDQLQARGIRCWLDEYQVLPGDDIYGQIDRGVKLWDKVLLCASKHSLESWWIRK